jgi:hypothetical protein
MDLKKPLSRTKLADMWREKATFRTKKSRFFGPSFAGASRGLSGTIKFLMTDGWRKIEQRKKDKKSVTRSQKGSQPWGRMGATGRDDMST